MTDEPVQTETAPQAQTEPQIAPQPETTENPVSEPNPVKLDSLATGQDPAPTASNGPTAEAPVLSEPSNSAEAPLDKPEAASNPESAITDKDQNLANEPLNQAPEPASEPKENTPENPNITVEKHGTDTIITEAMQPEPEQKPETAQVPPNEPLADWQAERRTENLKLANETRQEKKQEKIDKILELFSGQKEITNDEVEKYLHVSDATATRYLETLEKEGKIKQVGKTGKGVSYTKI